MDGSSGIATVIRKAWLAPCLATFQVAFAVSGAASLEHREKGLAHYARGACDSAAEELLKAVSAGDSSNIVLLHLAQALECDDRMVDALSATYIDHRADTTGRIDVLLYRAQLLRKLGLLEEAEKAEKEAGVVIAATSVADADDDGASSWNASPTASGSFGWMFQEDVLSTADSLRLTASRIGIRTEVLRNLSQPRSATDDSVQIQGQQIPLSATVGWMVDWNDYYLWIGTPLQATLKTDFSDWLETVGRVLVQVGGQWSNRWFEANASMYAAKNWRFYPGYDPLRSADLYVSGEGRRNFGSWEIVQSNSGNLALDESDSFDGYTGAHSLGYVRHLPWESSLSLGAGYSLFRDRSRDEFETLNDFVVKVIEVRGVALGMTNTDPSIEFLDSNGVAIPRNAINVGRARNGIHPAQRVVVRDGFDYPLESKRDWGRWNLGTVVTKNFGKKVVLKIGLDLARTELLHLQRGVYVPETDLYTDHWWDGASATGVGEMILYRDVRSGEVFWDGDQVFGDTYYLGPIFFERRRVDYTATATASLSWEVREHLATSVGWSRVRNRSNLAHLVEGSSYTRNLWNASASVSW